MAGRTWRRKRDRHRSDPDGGPGEFISASARTASFTTEAPRPEPDTSGPTGAPGPGTSPDADAYSAWAERLRQKRVNAQQTINGSTGSTADAPPNGANWRTENLYDESDRVAHSGAGAHRDPVELSAAYAVLQLDVGADLDAVDAQYRRLAKRHHPDRFIAQDEAVQREHAETFRSISTARDVIRQAHGTL